jgi:tetratricopeptide (TPR) repeat protein
MRILREIVAFLLLVMIVTAGHVEAATLKGVVNANELGGPPMPDVEVTAVAGGNPTASGSLGSFTLDFPNKKPGEPVTVIVKKPGYVVVNEIQLDLTLPADADAKPLIVLLCKEGNREEMARRFYRLKGLEAIEAEYKRRLKELEERHQADAATVANLQHERAQAKAALEGAAEESARAKLDQTSELYQQAVRLFLDGKVDEALQVLDKDKLRKELEAAREEKEEAEKRIEKVSQGYLLRAQLLVAQFRFDEATEAYRAAVEAAPESFAANFELARFSQILNRHQEASIVCRRCVGAAPESCAANVELARFSQILERHQEASVVCRRCVESAPESCAANFELAQFSRILERHQEASVLYRRCLELARKSGNAAETARTLNDLGMLEADQNRPEEARKAYEEALKTYRDLAQRDPETYLPGVAASLNNLGILEAEQNRPDEARKAYEDALRISRDLARRNPETYLPGVAGTLNDLGLLQAEQNRPDEARKAWEEALKIYGELAKQDSEQFLPHVQRVKVLLEGLPK